uniref:Uncharacterized protein n=1 Tax=Parastrongyloides trichosuri TaxID=131310 RepID=A0A0N5A3G3_PARTI
MNKDIFMIISSSESSLNHNIESIYLKNLMYGTITNSSDMDEENKIKNNNQLSPCSIFTSSFNNVPSTSNVLKDNKQSIFGEQIGAEILDEAVAIEYIQRMKTWCPPQCFEVFFGDVIDTPIEFMKINQLILAQGGSCYGGNIFKVQKYLLSIPQLLVKKGILSPAALGNTYIWDNWLADLSLQLNAVEWQAFWYIYTNVFGLNSLPIQLISFFNIFAQNQQNSQPQSIEQIIINAPLNPAFASYTSAYLNSVPFINNTFTQSLQHGDHIFNQKIPDNFNNSLESSNNELTPFYVEKRRFYLFIN